MLDNLNICDKAFSPRYQLGVTFFRILKGIRLNNINVNK